MKLYDGVKEPATLSALESFQKTEPNILVNIDQEFLSLENHSRAYLSLSTVYDQVSTESFSFIDKGNYILYNEYIKTITANLDIKPVTISQEAINTLPTVAINHHISLEGFIADMWAKIKALFAKIYDSIKQFFTSYFTRLGRLKKKLSNLQEVLKETDKDIKTLTLDSVPGSLASKYPVNGTVNLSLIQETFDNISIVSAILNSVNQLATNLAKKEIIGRDFVSEIKNLKDLSARSKEQIKENDKNKTTGLKSLYGKGKENNKQLNEDNKSLKEISEGAAKEADDKESAVVDIGNDSANASVDEDDKAFAAAKKEFQQMLVEIEKEFNKLKGKTLVNGMVITAIKVDENSGIELEKEESKDKPDTLTLAGRDELTSLINDTIKLVESVEKQASSYGTINDTIMKSLDNIDKIMKDIDGINMESLGKYKTVLNKKVRQRLGLMKTFFNTYNRVCKSLFTLVLDHAEGNSLYAVTSLKYFG